MLKGETKKKKTRKPLWVRFESGEMFAYEGDEKGPNLSTEEKVIHDTLDQLPKPPAKMVNAGKKYIASLSYFWTNPNCIVVNGIPY